MPSRRPPFDPLAFLTLAEVRGFLRRGRFGGAVVLFTLAYILGALFASGMVAFGHFDGGYTVTPVWWNPYSTQWWNYPGLLVIAPWGVITLPFFPTFAMLVVGVGVGFGMAVAALLTLRLLRPSPSEEARTKAVGALTGLTPAMISLVTLGACCSTTAAATAGVGLVAAASATSVANLLLNNWFLGVFQIAIVLVSLLAQELLLAVYGGLYGRGEPASAPRPPAFRPWIEVGALRAAALVGGILWSLSIAEAWTSNDPWSASAATWAGWLFERALPGLLAIGFALFPHGTVDAFDRLRRTRWGRRAGVAVAAAGVSLLAWYPASVLAAGWTGVGAELIVAVPFRSALALLADVARWAVEYAVLAAVALGLGVAPGRFGRWVARGLPTYADDRAVPIVPARSCDPDAAGPASSPAGSESS